MVTKEEEENNSLENLGKDIQMYNNDIIINSNNDFGVIKYLENLKQAIRNRLQTVKGELLLSTEYGSDLPLVIGQEINPNTIKELEGIVKQTLLQEPRVKEINDIQISESETQKDKLNVKIDVIAIDEINNMNLVFELFI